VRKCEGPLPPPTLPAASHHGVYEGPLGFLGMTVGKEKNVHFTSLCKKKQKKVTCRSSLRVLRLGNCLEYENERSGSDCSMPGI
jgi:hypothetical protein